MIRLFQNQCKCLFYMSANVIFVGKDNGTREVSKKVSNNNRCSIDKIDVLFHISVGLCIC